MKHVFSVIMPWGKHKGQLITDLPSGYLKWLSEECGDEGICSAADEEYRDRTAFNDHWE